MTQEEISPFFVLLVQEAFRKEKEIAAQQATVGTTGVGSRKAVASSWDLRWFLVFISSSKIWNWTIPHIMCPMRKLEFFSWIFSDIYFWVSHQKSTRGFFFSEGKMDLQVGRYLPMLPGESTGESWWHSRRAWGELAERKGELDPTPILKEAGDFGVKNTMGHYGPLQCIYGKSSDSLPSLKLT